MKLATIRTFELKHFTVALTAEEEYNVDLSWDETGEVSEQIDCGQAVVFCACCRVYLHGVELAADYLGNCIYKDFKDFLKPGGHARSMVTATVTEARKLLADLQSVKVRQEMTA